MIPFVVTDPNDPTEIVNLMTIKRVCDLANGEIAVHFVDGKILQYEGQAAQIIKGSCHIARAIYEQAVMQALQPSQIVSPAGGPAGRVM